MVKYSDVRNEANFASIPFKNWVFEKDSFLRKMGIKSIISSTISVN